jgi:hypothetical protein
MVRMRYRVKDAAVLIGVSTQAVRHRIRRGTLDSEKDEDGTVWVLLEPETVAPGDSPEDSPTEHPDDSSQIALVEYLREQLAAAEERERRSDERERELRRIIAGLVQRIPELPSSDYPEDYPEDTRQTEASESPGGDPVSASGESSRGTVGEAETEGEKPSERPSFWRRFFLGE